MARSRRTALVQGVAIAVGLLPLGGLALAAASGGLGANPIEKVTHETGEWALRLLLLTLAVTPMRRLFGWSWIAPLRRTFGLLAFTYATLHMLTWVVLDQFFDLRAMFEDVVERRFITAGATAFALLLPLAVTSTRAMMRRLGRRWQMLHRGVYAAAVVAVIHFVWLVKADLLEPLAYAAILALLLGYRLVRHWRARGAAEA